MSTKAAARRWLEDHNGATLHTHQTRHNGATWEPGPRRLEVQRGRAFLLEPDGRVPSELQLTPRHAVLELTAEHITVQWRAPDGFTLATTTYTTHPGRDIEPAGDAICGALFEYGWWCWNAKPCPEHGS